MTTAQQLITILVVAAGTMLTRFLPFLLFPAGKPTPKYIRYLGNVLPAAVGDDTGRRDATNSCAAKASASNPPNNPPNSTKDRSRFMLRKLRPTPE
jgi:hypothetical protein